MEIFEKFNLEKSEKWKGKEKWKGERRPDIAIVNKMEKTAIITDVAISGDKIITDKEKDKVKKYQNLERKIQ